MKHRPDDAALAALERAYADSALYDFARRTVYAYDDRMPTLALRPEELATMLLEELDEVKAWSRAGCPDTATWWDKPRYELRTALADVRVPPDETDTAVALALTMLQICVWALPEIDHSAMVLEITGELQAHIGVAEASRMCAELCDLTAMAGLESIHEEVKRYVEVGSLLAGGTRSEAESRTASSADDSPTSHSASDELEQMVCNALKRDGVSELKALKSRLYELDKPSLTAGCIERINARIEQLMQALGTPRVETTNVFHPGASQFNQSTLQHPTFGIAATEGRHQKLTGGK